MQNIAGWLLIVSRYELHEVEEALGAWDWSMVLVNGLLLVDVENDGFVFWSLLGQFILQNVLPL